VEILDVGNHKLNNMHALSKTAKLLIEKKNIESTLYHDKQYISFPIHQLHQIQNIVKTLEQENANNLRKFEW
jgi:hypothetical protein